MASSTNPAIAGYVRGLKEAKAAFQALPQIVRDALNTATEATAREIARNAKARVLASPSIQTRSLYDAIGWSMNKNNGRGRAGISNVTTTIRVGGKAFRIKGKVVGSRLIRPSRYAHLVEFGARHMPAEPFMIPSAEIETPAYLRRCQLAGRQIEKDAAAVGARYL